MTSEAPRLKKILYELDLPAGQWVLSGSGVMVLHGIERDRPMGDVDIFLATRSWFDLYHAGLFFGVMQGARLEDKREGWKIWTTHPNNPAERSDPPYLFKTIHGLEVNIFSGWRKRGVGDIDVAHWIHNAQRVDGIPCIPLQFLLDWKDAMGRAKDATDIERIREHLKRQEGS